MPSQALQSLEVVTLFDEALPLNTTVVLGALGYTITGGTAPYTLTWLKDDVVISTGDIAVIQPVSASNYALKVTDKNNCSTTTSLNLKTSNKVQKNQFSAYGITITPTIVTNKINVNFPSTDAVVANIRIFDMNGKLCFQKEILGTTTLDVNFQRGNYFVVLNASAKTIVEKIIVQ